MTIEEIRKSVQTSEDYAFLKTNEHLGKHIVMYGLGGSYAYGTNNENSDIDIRGIAINTPKEILLGKDFEEVIDTKTDTVIYSIRKIIYLLAACNPNIIEILGLNDDQVLYCDDFVWKTLRDNKDVFLSKRCVASFGGYANAQLRRLENKSARLEGQAQREKHILDSIRFAEDEFRKRYPEANIRLYTDASEKEDMESELFIDADLKHYPFRDFHSFCNEYHSVIRGYDKIGKRNQRAIEHDKLGKHSMHLVRLYLMCFDILEKGEINTYRAKEHDLLMDIRNGKYLDDNKQPLPAFYAMVDRMDQKLKELAAKSTLPDNPDMKRVDEILININKYVLERYM